jgi:hypothetical protein
MTNHQELIQACDRLLHECSLYSSLSEDGLISFGQDVEAVSRALKSLLTSPPAAPPVQPAQERQAAEDRP